MNVEDQRGEGRGPESPSFNSLELDVERKEKEKKKIYLDLNYTEFTEIHFVKYLASRTLQKWVSDLQKSYI